jgi:hypothetical protein
MSVENVIKLDVGSVHMIRLNEISELWGISWEEALRRAIDEFWLKTKKIFEVEE